MDLKFLEAAINRAENMTTSALANEALSAEERTLAGFPLETTLFDSVRVSDTACHVELGGPAHYLAIYEAYDNETYTLSDVPVDTFTDYNAIAELPTIPTQYEEIGLFYAPLDENEPATEDIETVFGLERYVKPDPNNPGQLLISPPSTGGAVCLIFKMALNIVPLAQAGFYIPEAIPEEP